MKAKVVNCKIDKNRLKWWLLSEINGKPKVFTYDTELPIKDYFFVNEKQKQIIETLRNYTEEQIENLENIDHKKYTTISSMRAFDGVFADHKYKDEKMWKVELPPYLKNKIRIELEREYNTLVFEADISYIELVFKDLGIKSAVEIKDGKIVPTDDFHIDIPHAFYDIETDDRKKILESSKREGFAKPDVARILSFSIWDTRTEKVKFYTHYNEYQLLLKFKEVINDFASVSAWNGEEFDKIMIHGRMKEHNIPFTWNKFYHLDAMKIHEMLNPKERKYIPIDMAAKKYLDIRKIQHTQSFYEMFEDYTSGKNKLLETYNNRDVEIMAKLEDKFGFEGVVKETSFNIGMLPQSYRYQRKPSQVLIRRFSTDHFGKRFIWKSKSEIPENIKFTGATVQEPIVGRWKHVIGIDLASLYNYIIQTFNISPEQLRIFKDKKPLFYITHDDQGKKLEKRIPIYPHDYKRYDHDGIMRRVLQVVEERRNEYKRIRDDPETSDEKSKLYDLKQQGEKAVLLSVYGGLGARGSTSAKEGGNQVSGKKEFYDFYCADDVTRYARDIIEMAKEEAEKLGFVVVYGDTDSVYIAIDSKIKEDEEIIPQVKAITKILLNFINDRYDKWLESLGIEKKWRKIKMEGQGYYSPFVILDKKKQYFAREIWNAERDKVHPEDHVELYGKGLKAFKPTSTDFHKKFLKELYIKILKYEDGRSIMNWINSLKNKLIETNEYEEIIVLEKKLTQMFFSENEAENYKTDSAELRYAKQLVEEGKLQEKGAIYYKFKEYGYIIKEDKEGNNKLSKTIKVCGEFEQTEPEGREYFWNHHVKKDIFEVMDVAFGVWELKRENGKHTNKLLQSAENIYNNRSIDEFF